MDFVETEGQLLPEQQPEEKPASWKRFLLDFVETVVLAVALFLAINTVSARVRVEGSSMLPTLHNGEYVLVNRLAYLNSLPERGDIIVFKSPLVEQDLIKRVIGLPGDTVKIFDNEVSVNGQLLDEPYIADSPRYSGEWNVPAEQLFVLGDNRNDSSDSHAWGLLPMENVIGKAILIYWPPMEWNLIEHVETLAALP